MRAVDALAREHAERRKLRPLRTYTDLEHERDDWRPLAPKPDQLALAGTSDTIPQEGP